MADEVPRLLILADDLSGAADCGVVCVETGLTTLVLLHVAAPPERTAVLVADLHSRKLSAAGAQDAVRRAADRLLAPGGALYKKIDSTLRGQPAAEIAAARDAVAARAGAPALAVVTPAFPAVGRTVRDGRVLVHGEPLAQTEIWRREGTGGAPDFAGMLAAAGVATRGVRLEAVRSPGLPDLLRRAAEQDTGAVLCDAETDADLAAIAAAGGALPHPVVWAGSAGLARHVGAMLAEGRPRSHAAAPRRRAGPVAAVIGSMSGVARTQVARLAERRDCRVVTLAPDELRSEPVSPRWRAAERRFGDALAAAGDDCVVAVSIGAGPGMPESSLCAALARLVAPHLDRMGALVVSGGETARAVLGRAGVTGLRLVGEVGPGVPLGLALGRPGPDLPVVTKAGAFGSAATLTDAVAALRALPHVDGRPQGVGAMEQTRPLVAITMGDAAGIGPEVIMKALAHAESYAVCRPLVIGDAARLRQAGALGDGAALEVRVAAPEDGAYALGTVDCIDVGGIPPGLPWGQISAAAGKAAFQFIRVATELAMARRVDAICTAPLNKEALHLAGRRYPGHTEMLAELTGTPEVSMMLMTPRLRVIHVTTHIGLLDAIDRIEPGLVERTIARGHATLLAADIAAPRIGVCGINPHAGEHGLFGRGEEEAKIIPAVEQCRARGWDVTGPLPADTLFFRAGRGDFDLVVAMYHDQGHGPVKVLGIEAGVNVTVGLPVIRTSVDHGTAFDIAGTGRADERSMQEALRQAASLAPSRDQ